MRKALKFLGTSDKIVAIREGAGRVAVIVKHGEARDVYVLDAEHGAVTLAFESPTQGVADMEVHRILSNTQPTVVEILRAYGVPRPGAFAKARMAPLKAAILRELRAMRLYPYYGWDEIREALPSEETEDVFSRHGTPPYPAKASVSVMDERAQMELYEAMAEEIAEWMRTGAVRALKRLGKRAFEADDQPASPRRDHRRGRRHRV